MTHEFKVGDRVTWNSEGGRLSGTIRKVHTKSVDYRGRTRYASAADPQYEIDSDETDRIALHKGAALRKSEP